MAKNIRLPEEFLWKLHELLEGAQDVHARFGFRSFHDLASPEWREFRLAYEKKKLKRSFRQFISYLRQQGYIKVPSAESMMPLQLTPKGRQKALAGKKKGVVLQDRKDGKMIMLMYDIPKNKQRVRDAFRAELGFLGYEMLQKSVLVSSRDVLEATEKLVRGFGLQDHVNLFVIEKVRTA